MNLFDQYAKKQREVQFTARLTWPFVLAAPFFAGWIFFLTYDAFRLDTWPYIGLWTAFGLSYLFSYVVNRMRGR